MAIKKENKTRAEDLCDYLRKNAQKGYTLESLKWALIKQGNQRSEVEKAIAIVEKEISKTSLKQEVKPQITLEQNSPTINASSVVPEKVPFWKRFFGSS